MPVYKGNTEIAKITVCMDNTSTPGELDEITVSSGGLVTARVKTSGQLQTGTQKTLQLSAQAAKTVTPSESAQTAVASGKYTTGAVTVGAIPSSYIGSGVQVIHVYTGSSDPSSSVGVNGDLYIKLG